MPKAVKFDEYGDLDVLKLIEVDFQKPTNNQVLIKIKAAGINPGEDKIRSGAMHNVFPASFPSGEGTDFAGTIEAIGDQVEDFKAGDDVVGFTHERNSHAEYIIVDQDSIIIKPESISFEVAGSLFVAGTTAYAAVKAVNLAEGETVIISGAAGGVGVIASQLAVNEGARVIGIANENYHKWLAEHHITPVSYKEDTANKIKAMLDHSADAFIDTSGHGYVQMAVEELGISPDRIDTIIDFSSVAKYKVKAEGSASASTIEVLKELINMIANGSLEIPIAKTFKLDDVKEAYKYLESKHEMGKVVLIP